MDADTQKLVDELRDRISGLTPSQRYQVYLAFIDGYRLIQWLHEGGAGSRYMVDSKEKWEGPENER